MAIKKHPPPFDWVKRINECIPESTEIPLFGNAPPFDWDRLSSLLAAKFETSDFSIRPTEQVWRSVSEVQESLAPNSFIAAIALNPLSSHFYFSLPKADKNRLAAWMMQGAAKSQISEPLKEGFCRFLILEALEASAVIDPLSKLTPWLAENESIPKEKAFCIDIELSFEGKSCWGRLIFPSSFRKEWVSHFAKEREVSVSNEAAKSIELILGLECGAVILTQAQWNAIEQGDFVILDTGTYDIMHKTGISVLKIGSIPLFQTQITQNKLTLLDYASIQKEPMEKNNTNIDVLLTPLDEKIAPIQDIALNVSVELARFKITLDHLMRLAPGNTLELPLPPDQSVSLVVNGKKVGRAELLRLGESFGIRILEVG